jgi:hypothetical protein
LLLSKSIVGYTASYMSELTWLLVGLFVLFILWGATGGTEHYASRSRQFIEHPVDGGQIYSLEELREGTRP